MHVESSNLSYCCSLASTLTYSVFASCNLRGGALGDCFGLCALAPRSLDEIIHASVLLCIARRKVG